MCFIGHHLVTSHIHYVYRYVYIRTLYACIRECVHIPASVCTMNWCVVWGQHIAILDMTVLHQNTQTASLLSTRLIHVTPTLHTLKQGKAITVFFFETLRSAASHHSDSISLLYSHPLHDLLVPFHLMQTSIVMTSGTRW